MLADLRVAGEEWQDIGGERQRKGIRNDKHAQRVNNPLTSPESVGRVLVIGGGRGTHIYIFRVCYVGNELGRQETEKGQ